MRPRKKQTEKKEAGWKVMLITIVVKEERRVGKGEDTAGVRGAAVLWCQSPVEYPGHPESKLTPYVISSRTNFPHPCHTC